MMKPDRTIRLVNADEKKQWNTVVSHPLQSWEWGEFRQKMGVQVVRLGVFEKNKLIEGWQITLHALPLTPYTVGYFPKGPMPTLEMVDELKRIGKEKKVIFIQLEPDISVDTPNDINLLPSVKPAHHALFTKHTFVLDLTKSEDELLAAMHSKTRYNIKLAQRHGVVIKEDNSDTAFAEYLRLSEETTNRQGFYAHNRRYHQEMWKTLSQAGIAKLFTATHEGSILSAWIVFVWKDTLYYPYGSSSRINREVMAPNLLLWELVIWAKKKGLFYFDLWGALGPNADPHDPWRGFHRFKEGYKPNLIEFVGSFDLVILPIHYFLFTAIDTLRWILLKLKSSR
jgi:lipid II:glycine glycyltransferase (peptidoglycan interpeptide bridge formation enzyme)